VANRGIWTIAPRGELARGIPHCSIIILWEKKTQNSLL